MINVYYDTESIDAIDSLSGELEQFGLTIEKKEDGERIQISVVPTGTTKVLVCGDNDGHLNVCRVFDRPKAWKFITQLCQDGDYYANEYDSQGIDLPEDPLTFDVNSLSDTKWLDMVEAFSMRGCLEICSI